LMGYLQTTPQGEHHHCVHFNKTDGTCGVYSKRPFECALYPFVVSKDLGGIKIYMHLACPYIQEKEVSVELQSYADYLKSFFSLPATRQYLKTNSRLLHDYSEFEKELRLLFTIEV
jgi:hypothetical protein